MGVEKRETTPVYGLVAPKLTKEGRSLVMDSATSTLHFETIPLELEAAFNCGRITSYGGNRWLAAAAGRRRQFDTLRLLVVKVGGRVKQLFTRARLHLASRHPGQRLWYALSSAAGNARE